jgi:chromosome segregation ATPase
MTTTPKMTVTYSIEDILARIEDKMDARFEKLDARFEKIDRQFERLENKMDTRFAEVDQRLNKLEVGQAELSGDIKALEEKVDGIGRRLDNQEFLNRGVAVAVLAALLAGSAKLFGFLPKG